MEAKKPTIEKQTSHKSPLKDTTQAQAAPTFQKPLSKVSSMTEAEIFCQTNQMQETNDTIDMLSQMLNSVTFPNESTQGELDNDGKQKINQNYN